MSYKTTPQMYLQTVTYIKKYKKIILNMISLTSKKCLHLSNNNGYFFANLVWTGVFDSDHLEVKLDY